MEKPDTPNFNSVESQEIDRIIENVKFDEEESDNEEDEDAYEQDGFLQKRQGNNKKPPTSNFRWSSRYFILKGGSLHVYKSAADSNPKKTIDLRTTQLDNQLHKSISPFCFVLKREKPQLYLLLNALNEQEYKEWMRSLPEAYNKPPTKPPKRIKNKKNGFTLRAKKKIGEKVVTSNLGKTILREVMTTDTYTIMNALQTFISKESGATTATRMYNDILKLVVKIYILCREGALTQKDFWNALKLPLIKVFSALIDSWELSFSFDPHQLTRDVVDLEKVLEKVLTPHFSTQNVVEMKYIFEFFSNQQTWIKLYTEDQYAPQISAAVKVLRNFWNSIQNPTTNNESLVIVN